jgi:glycosyltransferase involved in cell wall biosynthesis
MSQPIRVLYILSSFAIEGPLGGVARFVVELSRSLDRTQVTPMLAGLWDYHTPYDRQWLERLHNEGFEAFIASSWEGARPYYSCVQAFQGVRQYCRTHDLRPDIIHAHGEFNDLSALALWRAAGAKVLVRTVHNEFEWAKRPLFGLLFPNVIYPLAFTQELGVSQQVVENLDRRPLARLLGRRGRRMYNAINFERFAHTAVDGAAKRHSIGIPAGAQLVGTVGRLVAQKGYSVLLQAIPRVLAQAPDAWFIIVGTGPLQSELEAQASRQGIAERVLFLGARTDVEELYAILDLFVSSSLWEGLPTVLLEAMAAHVPVVATAVSGSTELVEPDVTGLVVASNDAEALATAIVRQLRERDRAQAMALAALARAKAQFSIQSIAQQHVALYRQLLGQAGAASGHDASLPA